MQSLEFPPLDGKTFLTAIEYQQVERIFKLLIPANHKLGIPGAIDAGATDFLNMLLAMDDAVYYKISTWRTICRDGLKELDDSAKHSYGNSLLLLDDHTLKSFLGQLENGSLTNTRAGFDQKQFFKLILDFCIKGCFSDPRWGGNKDSIMWTWFGWTQPARDITF
jgi:gluconate 2-dehydrogenase gamma chain